MSLRIKNKLLKKAFALLTLFFLLGQNILYSGTVLAQETTPIASEQPLVEVVAPTPTVEVTVLPTVEPTPTVEVSPTTIPTPTSVPPSLPTIDPDPQPSQALPTIVPQITPPEEIVPVEITNNEEKPSNSTEQVGGLVVALQPSVESLRSAQLIPSLVTDKGDYAPWEKVLISGKDLQPNTQYQIKISANEFSFEDNFTTFDNGTFLYQYQLDGTYRPNYLVEIIKDNQIIASITFTDDIQATLPFFDTFGTVSKTTVDNWDELHADIVGSSGEDSPISSSNTKFAKIGSDDGYIKRTINSSGYANLQLKFYWKGDNDAGSSDKGVVEYCLGASCSTFPTSNRLAFYSLNTEGWNPVTIMLPSSLDNTVFKIRFRNDANGDDGYFRVDDVEITGSDPRCSNLTGAIYTTDSGCDTVNGNLFSSKSAVYLDGGPHGNGGSGLPDGNYYVKVTEPDGTLLGSSGTQTVSVVNGEFVSCINLYTLTNYADTTNSGGEYKVWASPDSTFPESCSKTDNFKVRASCTDSDSDGICDSEDNCPNNANPNQEDRDGDGIGDSCDNCVSNSNSDQQDSDGDRIGNSCDNCINQANASQTDTDRDGIGDVCDAPLCGNDVIETGETCDNGSENGEVCIAGYGQSCQYCSDSCSIETVEGPYCGDDIVNGEEECDGTSNCTEECTFNENQYCGDGIKNAEEQCDGDDGTPKNYQCTDECTLEYVPYCGDGEVNQETEQCDGEDRVGDNQSCTEECTFEDEPYCGDNEVNQETEECDGEAGVGEHQSCSIECTLEDEPYCGDGKLYEEVEQCDDGNTANGDGCNASCQIEEESPDPTISIAKENNKPTANPNDQVTYTLTLTNGNIALSGVVVKDILPFGFSYVLNSAKIDGLAGEPTIDGQILEWSNINLSPNQIVKITYIATIASYETAGNYYNLATCQAEQTRQKSINCSLVKSKVSINQGNSYSDSIGGTTVRVLGASTGQVLGAATGSETYWLILAFLMIASGSTILFNKKRKELKE